MFRNILGIIVGIILGGLVNMGLVTISGSIIPPPEGVNPSDIESLKSGMHLFAPKHFIMPFLAHSLGTLVGVFVASLIAVSHHFKIAIGLSAFFMIGGIAAATMLPAPLWFEILDIALAYIPMGYLGWKLSGKDD